MKAILYARVSTEDQGKSHLGLSAQIAEMKQFCTFHNIEIIDIREEVVCAGYPLERRPVLSQSFQDARRVKGCHIITSRVDRLSRSAYLVESMMKNGIKFKVVECGINSSNLEIRIKAAMAEEDRLKIADRTKRALEQKNERGEPMGFELPVQKSKFWEIHNASIKAIKSEADSFAAFMKDAILPHIQQGKSYTEIAKHLNKHNIKTQRGGEWWPQTVKNITLRW